MITTTTLLLILAAISLRQIRRIRNGRLHAAAMGQRLERAVRPGRHAAGVRLFHRTPDPQVTRVVFLPERMHARA